MPIHEANMRETCEYMALTKLQGKELYLIIESKPYIKKSNLNGDKASWQCWQVILRKQNLEDLEVGAEMRYMDLFITLLRRKFIPPLCETY